MQCGSGGHSWWRRPAFGPALALCVWAAGACADIYRYRDAQGNWNFTDKPPAGAKADRILDIVETTKKATAAETADDLNARLEAALNPITPIARATLAVVTVKTGFGDGSGFFCSEDGYILTNRHVVRPSETGQFDERAEAIAGQTQRLGAAAAELEAGREQLRLMERDLQGYARVIERAHDDATSDWAKEAHARLLERYQAEEVRLDGQSRQLRGSESELRKSRRDLDWGRNAEAVKATFDIVLKDGTELPAALVAISPNQDLALLKVDGQRTPFLGLDNTLLLSQGMRVFAIGSPLGMHDSVTSGVITQITGEYIVSDAQVLPGSSGGPLIAETGEVLGINVAKQVADGESMYTAGFGKAIPVAAVRQEFPDALGDHQVEPPVPRSGAYPPITPEREEGRAPE